MTASPQDVTGTLLVADDDPDIVALVKFRFEQAGYKVLTAPDGDQALRLIQERRPQLALLDVRMPGLDGREVTRRIRDTDGLNTMAVIILSGSVKESDIDQSLEA